VADSGDEGSLKLIENSGAAILDAAITTAIPPPVWEPRRTPEFRPRKLAGSVSRVDRVQKDMAKAEVGRAMLHTRCVAPLRLSHTLMLILANGDRGHRVENNVCARVKSGTN